jgi:hypothetical protein
MTSAQAIRQELKPVPGRGQFERVGIDSGKQPAHVARDEHHHAREQKHEGAQVQREHEVFAVAPARAPIDQLQVQGEQGQGADQHVRQAPPSIAQMVRATIQQAVCYRYAPYYSCHNAE